MTVDQAVVPHIAIHETDAFFVQSQCVSPLDDFDDEEKNATEQGIRFKRLIMDKTATSRAKDDSLPIDLGAKRVVFCTGKVRVSPISRDPPLRLPTPD